MKNQAEPPSCLRPPIFMIGQDSQGNWVARDQSGTRGGLFVNRAEALRPQAFVTVSGIFELDMTRAQDAAPQRQPGVDAKRELRVA
jgi:hypothetical protein